jgi:hypothetical protein
MALRILLDKEKLEPVEPEEFDSIINFSLSADLRYQQQSAEADWVYRL